MQESQRTFTRKRGPRGRKGEKGMPGPMGPPGQKVSTVNKLAKPCAVFEWNVGSV